MTRLRPGRHARLGLLLTVLWLLLAASITHAQTNTGFSGFSRVFDPVSSNIVYTTTNYSGFFRAGDPIGLGTRDGSALRVFAWYGDLLYTGSATNLTLPVGHYFVEAGNDRNEFAVLSADWPTLSNLGNSGGYGPDPNVQAIQSFLKLGWIRGTFHWDTVQAGGSNSWDWSFTDQIISLHHGVRKIEIIVEGAPSWVQNPNTGVWKLTQARWLQAYTRFLQAVGQRYTNAIDAIEVWNEPSSDDLPTTNFTDTTTLYVQMLAAARAAFPPSVKISGPTFQSSLLIGNAQSVATNGGAPYIDYDSFHDYDTRNGAPDIEQTNDLQWLTIPERVQQNSAVFHKPLMVDEIGLYGQSALGANLNPVPITGDVLESGINWFTGMTYAVKYAVMYAAGEAIVMPQGLVQGSSSAASNFEINGFDIGGRGPHPKTSAFLMSQYWLTGSTLVGWRSLGQQIFLYAWQRPDHTSLVFAWTIDGQTAPLSTNSALTVTDIYGRPIEPTTLDHQPPLFHSAGSDAAGLLDSVMAALPHPNLPPVLDFLGNQNVLKNQPLHFSVSATDPDHDPLTYAVDSLPAGATFDATSGAFDWTPDASQTGVYPLTFTVTDARGLTDSATMAISVLNSETDGLVDDWTLDESAGLTAADAAGTNPGALANFNFTAASGWVPGKIGNALSFDGANDYVNLDSTQFHLTNNFSISLWLYPRDAGGDRVFLSVCSMYAASGYRFWIHNNSLQIEGQTTAGWNITGYALNEILNNTWYHVVLVYDKSNMYVYVNGSNLVPAYGASRNWGGDILLNPVYPSRLGAEGFSSLPNYFFNGTIDDVRIYNRTLIPAEVLALYQAADQPPVLAAIGPKAVVTGQPLAFSLSASDPDSATLTFSASSLPSGASLNAATGAFAWTPSNSQIGSYNVTFSASDGLLTSSQPATITVTSNSGLITVEANPSSGGSVSGGGLYLIGASKQIAASPNPGWTFAGWNDGNSQNPRTVTVTSGGGTYTANLIRDIMPTTSGMSVTNPVMQFNNLAVVAAGDENVFAFDAGDWASNTLYYVWTFGDGDVSNRSTTSTPSHVYTNCGPYAASVVVDDGVSSTNASFTVSVACQLVISRLQATLNFARTNADRCTIRGAFDLPPDYSFAGKLVVVDVGGATMSFALDVKGRGRNGVSTFNRPSYNKRTGLWTFNASLRNGSWQNLWTTYGLMNADVLKPGVTVSPPVVLVIDNEAFMEIPNLVYTARLNKSGTAR